MQNETAPSSDSSRGKLLILISGVLIVVMGLIGIAFGSIWSEQAFTFFADVAIMEAIGTYAPYFPFVPFYPVILIMLGTYLIIKSRG